MKMPMKVSITVQRIVGTFSGMRSRMPVSFKCIFSEEDHLWFFLQMGNIIFVTFIHIYKKYHISMYLLRKIIFHFPSKEKISCFPGKKYHLSKYTRKIIFQRNLFGKTMFSGHFEENIIFPCIFEKDHVSFSV